MELNKIYQGHCLDVLKTLPNESINTFRAIRDKRNKRSVWTVSTKPLKEAHFAVYPEDLIEPCVLAGCPLDGVVMDPFFGSGTTGLVALKHGRNFIGIELNPDYIKIAEKRLSKVQLELIHELGC